MYIITIDGPASSGKGTIAKIVAKQLAYHYLDSGAIYRVLALLTLQNHLTLANNQDQILDQIKNMDLKFLQDQVLVNGNNVTNLIRGEGIGMHASDLAKNSLIRSKLLALQQSFAQEPGLVTDGRDMGSVVFPQATLKVFLTASAQTRAQRRYLQLQLQGNSVTMEAILRDIMARDEQDLGRKAAPLSYDKSFKVLDNSLLSIEETVSQILAWFAEKINC